MFGHFQAELDTNVELGWGNYQQPKWSTKKMIFATSEMDIYITVMHRCEFPHSAADNYDAFILLTVLFPTVINPFQRERGHHDRWDTSCACVLPL